jgi:hypothetical protein
LLRYYAIAKIMPAIIAIRTASHTRTPRFDDPYFVPQQHPDPFPLKMHNLRRKRSRFLEKISHVFSRSPSPAPSSKSNTHGNKSRPQTADNARTHPKSTVGESRNPEPTPLDSSTHPTQTALDKYGEKNGLPNIQYQPLLRSPTPPTGLPPPSSHLSSTNSPPITKTTTAGGATFVPSQNSQALQSTTPQARDKSDLIQRQLAYGLEKAKKGLKDTEVKELPTDGSLDNVMEEAHKLQENMKDKQWSYEWRGREVLVFDKVATVVRYLEKYAKIGDIFIQHQPEVTSLIWGSFRFLLQVLYYFHLRVLYPELTVLGCC